MLFPILGGSVGSLVLRRNLDARRRELDRILIRGMPRAEAERRLQRHGLGVNHLFKDGSSTLDRAHGYFLIPNGWGFTPFPQHRFIRMTFTFAGDRLESWGCEDEIDRLY